MPATSEPRFETYEVFHRHTNKVIGTYGSRAEAESHATDHAHRVRGGTPVKPAADRTRMAGTMRQIAKLARGEK